MEQPQSPPPDSPPPASQDGHSDGEDDETNEVVSSDGESDEADVASRTTEDVVHILLELKESVKELRKDVAKINEQTERVWWDSIVFKGLFGTVVVYFGIVLLLKDLQQDTPFISRLVSKRK